MFLSFLFETEMMIVSKTNIRVMSFFQPRNVKIFMLKIYAFFHYDEPNIASVMYIAVANHVSIQYNTIIF